MNKEIAIAKLQNDLRIRRYEHSTIDRYTYIVKLFLKFKSEKNINELCEEDAIDYLNFLTVERNYKSSSYNNVNAILKFFLEVTLDKSIAYRRMPNAKVPVRDKMIPTHEEVLRIIEGAHNVKQKCWFALAYGSGLRCGEVARLRVADIDSNRMKIKVLGKGNKERLTVLPDKTLALLRQYCIESKTTKYDEYLFVGKDDEFISESCISRSLKKVVEELGLDSRITMHALRRSFATHALRIGVPIEVVKELMGHNSISTTMGYIKVVYENLEIKNPLDSEFNEIYNSTGI